MIEEDLIKTWQSSPNRERVKFEKSLLMIELQVRVSRFQEMTRYGNRKTIMAALITVVVYAFYIYIIPFTLSKLASGLVAVYGVYVVMKFRKVRRDEPRDFTGSYSAYLHKTKRFLLSQKQLTDTSLYWAILPAMSFCILFFLGFIESPLFTTTAIIALCVGSIVIGVIVFFLTRWWVDLAITPNLKKIDELIRTLEE